MKNLKTIQESFFCSLGALLYIALVSLFFMNGEHLLGAKINAFWGPILLLSLFIISALITGLLILGRPIWLYLEGQKKEAVTQLFYTIGWMIVAFFVIFGIMLVI
ncbi:MAG: hypothetical protein ABH881_00265 [bacterium]